MCLFDAGEVEIIRSAGQHINWRVKAVVADENDIGVVAIQAADRTLLFYAKSCSHATQEVLQVMPPPRKMHHFLQ